MSKVADVLIKVGGFFIMLVIIVLVKTFFKSPKTGDEFIVHSEPLPDNTKKMLAHFDINKDISDTGSCLLSTKGIEDAKGENILFYFPCGWDKGTEDELPEVIGTYSHTVGDSLVIGSIYLIQKSPVSIELNRAKMEKESFFEGIVKEKGEIPMNVKRVQIDGLSGGEVSTEVEGDNGNDYLFSLQYYLYHKENIIQVKYYVGSHNKMYAYETFQKYKPLFKRLIMKTDNRN